MDDTSSDAAVKRGRSKGALCGVFFIFKPYPLFKQDSGCGRETFLPGGLPAPSPVRLWCQPTCASGSDDPHTKRDRDVLHRAGLLVSISCSLNRQPGRF